MAQSSRMGQGGTGTHTPSLLPGQTWLIDPSTLSSELGGKLPGPRQVFCKGRRGEGGVSERQRGLPQPPASAVGTALKPSPPRAPCLWKLLAQGFFTRRSSALEVPGGSPLEPTQPPAPRQAQCGQAALPPRLLTFMGCNCLRSA